MAGANISYKRTVCDAHDRFIEGAYCSDTEFHWRLAREGIRIRFDPAIVVFHPNLPRLGQFLRHEFFHGMSFAIMLCAAKVFNSGKRRGYSLLSPLIFLKLLATNAARGICFGAYTVSYLRALPLSVLGSLCWTAGEAAAAAVSHGAGLAGMRELSDRGVLGARAADTCLIA